MILLGADPFLDLHDVAHVGRDLLRLLLATVLGGLIGLERQQEGKAAGLRTHMLVALGAALFALIPLEGTNGPPSEQELNQLSRVMQGIVTGIGFLGAGTILKLGDQREIKGLTTAASIWLTAAVGMAVGVGWLWPALLATLLALLVLFFVHHLERWIKQLFPARPPHE
jgi:putative Mg2+ transporter-C (MgtC) family protein